MKIQNGLLHDRIKSLCGNKSMGDINPLLTELDKLTKEIENMLHTRIKDQQNFEQELLLKNQEISEL